jgi:site-specific recombinase XerD
VTPSGLSIIPAEQSCVDSTLHFHAKRHPNQMRVPEIEAFFTHLAVQERVAGSTQNQALSALLFLYRYVLHQPLEDRIDAVRAKRSRSLPTVLTPEEAQSRMGGDRF